MTDDVTTMNDHQCRAALAAVVARLGDLAEVNERDGLTDEQADEFDQLEQRAADIGRRRLDLQRAGVMDQVRHSISQNSTG